METYHIAMESLRAEDDGSDEPSEGWSKPNGDTDKLFMSVGGNTIIEVGHPTPKNGESDPRYIFFLFLCQLLFKLCSIRQL